MFHPQLIFLPLNPQRRSYIYDKALHLSVRKPSSAVVMHPTVSSFYNWHYHLILHLLLKVFNLGNQFHRTCWVVCFAASPPPPSKHRCHRTSIIQNILFSSDSVGVTKYLYANIQRTTLHISLTIVKSESWSFQCENSLVIRI